MILARTPSSPPAMSFHNDKRLLLYYRRHTAHGLATHAVDAIVPEHDLIDTSPQDHHTIPRGEATRHDLWTDTQSAAATPPLAITQVDTQPDDLAAALSCRRPLPARLPPWEQILGELALDTNCWNRH
jgi:hypothetical protein